MKKLLIILSMLCGLTASAQFPAPKYTKVSTTGYWWTQPSAFTNVHLPGRGANDTTLAPGQSIASGAFIIDTVNHVPYFLSGGVWRNAGGATLTTFANGLSLVNDTAKLGSLTTGLTDSVTFIQVPTHAYTAQFEVQTTPSRQLIIHNRPYDSVKGNQTAGRFPYWAYHGGNQLLIMEREFFERLNDTANTQYMGIQAMRHTMTQDFNSTRYDSAVGKETTLQNGGIDAGYSFFPIKNIKFRPSPFGNHGVTMYSTTGIGKDSSFTINLLKSTVSPVPWATNATLFSFNSQVPLDKQRIIRNHDGALGTAGYAAWWKSGQGESSYTIGTGSKMDRHADFFSVGGHVLKPTGEYFRQGE